MKEQIKAKWRNWTSNGFRILGSGLKKYNLKCEAASQISLSNGIRAAGLAATTSSHAITRTNVLVINLRSYDYVGDLENKS